MLKGTCIFRRKFPPPLYRKDQTGPFRPPLEDHNYLYILEDTLQSRPAGDIQVILAADVEGILSLVVLQVAKLMVYNNTNSSWL